MGARRLINNVICLKIRWGKCACTVLVPCGFFYGDSMEIWKDIKSYEGIYQISNYGRVKGKNGIRKTPINSSGYKIVKLCKNGKIKFYSVHKLVANAFIPNPLNLPIINHKDENKQNNFVENLEWCTQKYNSRYSNSKSVSCYDFDGNLVSKFDAAIDAENEMKIDSSLILKCCRGKRKTAGGYVWKYEKALD